MKNLNLAEFKLIGLRLPHKTTNEKGQSNTDCGQLWQKFEKEDFSSKIPGKVSDEIYAVYFGYEGNHTKPFSYFIGCKTNLTTTVPTGMDSLIIPDQTYLKIIAKGKMPDCISDSWEKIWNSELNRSFAYDFEIYDERSRDWNNAEVDILVSVG